MNVDTECAFITMTLKVWLISTSDQKHKHSEDSADVINSTMSTSQDSADVVNSTMSTYQKIQLMWLTQP